jgi:hypothetical protein
MNDQARARAADDLFHRIRPSLGGYSPDMQGAVLAQLVALWLAGHVSDDAAEQDAVREQLLDQLVDTIQRLTPVMYEQHVRPAR